MGKRQVPLRRRSAASRGRSEWIGGRLSPPFFITDRDEPYRIRMDLWMELPSGLIVGQAVMTPEETGQLGQILKTALERPLAGPPRRPHTIRVADAALAAEVRSAVGDMIPIRVAPTPELDEFLDLMVQSKQDLPDDEDDLEDASYLEDGRITPAAVASLFRAASTLYRVAPWKVVHDHQLIRMDIPALGVAGACLSIIGNLGESLGFIIFPSDIAFEAFLRATESAKRSKSRPDLGTDWLALCYTDAEDVPKNMRDEARANGWQPPGDDAWPVVERRERDGAARPLVGRDVEIVTAAAWSLAALMEKRRDAFEAERFTPIAAAYRDNNDVEVRFTVPYDAYELFEAGAREVGRNDPCPCGSGRKYKKCHGQADGRAAAAWRAVDKLHEVDRQLVNALLGFGHERFGPARWRFVDDFADASEAAELSMSWAVFHYRIDGSSVLEWFLEERARDLSDQERDWLASQKAAWLSIWEVTAVEPGAGLTLCDMLSGEIRKVREKTASQTLARHDAVLGRVVDHAGVSVLAGMYPRKLPPLAAADVVRRARGKLQRKSLVPVERLRDDRIGRYLIKRWEEMVRQLEQAPAMPRRLTNTDGHDLLLTTDHFTIVPGAEATIEARLAAMEDVEPPLPDESPVIYTFVRAAAATGPQAGFNNLHIGGVEVSPGTLRVHTNSRERADALRRRLEDACGDRIRHRAREHADPLSSKVKPSRAPEQPDVPPEELARVVRELKERHYAGWIDESLPALNGKTPRETARTAKGRAAKGRAALVTLLKDMEQTEQRLPPGQAYDFGPMRRQLDLD